VSTLLIIGGTGFFGKSILDSYGRGILQKFNISKIFILARNADKFKLEFPELLSDNVELISGDISTISKLPIVDFVIHAASSTNMNEYKKGQEEIGKKSIENSVTNYCRIAPNFHSKSKILYCSSGAVYGKQPIHLENIDEKFEFQSDLSNLSAEKKIYCMSKRFAEDQIKELGKNGMCVSIARCFAFSGKYLPKNQHYAYGNFIAQAEKGETITVNANGVVYRSYLEADDLVISLFKILFESGQDCPIYNVGSDQSISLHELAETIANKYGVKSKHNILDQDNIIDRYVPNIDKLKALLNR
jgi:dTDP-glucose 4,6-dehydratase